MFLLLVLLLTFINFGHKGKQKSVCKFSENGFADFTCVNGCLTASTRVLPFEKATSLNN